MIKKWIVLGLLVCIILGCSHNPDWSVLYKTGKISLLFVNKLNEEVLVKSKKGDIAFLGVFLLPEQQYLWEIQDSMEMYHDKFEWQTTFDFFTEGESHKFDKYVGEDTFKLELTKERCDYADTCYIK